MKKNFILLCMATAFTLGITGCSKDDVSGGETPDVVEGKEATVFLNLSFPKTYAADANATVDESKVENVDIFVINPSNGGVITHQNVDKADLTDKTNNKWETTAKIKTTSGNRKILVGVNLPASIRSTIAQNGLSGADETTIHNVTYGMLSDATNGFAMFSTKVTEQTLYSDDEITADPTLSNAVELSVERMVAKVSVNAGSVDTSPVTDGTFTGVYEYTLGKVNRKTYALQYKDGMGIVRDPNYMSSDYQPAVSSPVYPVFNNSDFFGAKEDITGYVATDGTAFKYAPENVAELALRGTNTFVSVKAVFEPTMYSSATGTDRDGVNTNNGSFWTVTLSDGTVKYFDQEATADSYYAQEDTAGNDPVKSEEYVEGVCYYKAYLSVDNGYNVLRNNFYRVSITKINSLGSPDPDDDDEEEEPIDGDFAYITVEIDIEPWNVVTESHELGK